MKKEMRYARLFTGLCIILAVMGLSIGTAGAATVTQALVNGTCFDPANSYVIATQGSLNFSNGAAITKVVGIAPTTGQGPFISVSDNATMLTQAAEKLGVTEQALANALNVTTNTPVSLKSAAGQLGVTQQQLMDALGLPSRVTVTSGNTGIFADISNVTVLTHAAEKLGVSEQTLADALNINTPTGKTTDLNSAAKQLGITQQQLADALGFTAAPAYVKEVTPCGTAGSNGVALVVMRSSGQ